MYKNCICKPKFHTGEKIVSLVFHPPEIESGSEATIISPHVENLYAVKLPDGELHRWFAGSELQALSPSNSSLKHGDIAIVTNDYGHPPKIVKGMTVKIAKVIPQTCFYDLRLENGKYHRWLAEFEITSPI